MSAHNPGDARPRKGLRGNLGAALRFLTSAPTIRALGPPGHAQ